MSKMRLCAPSFVTKVTIVTILFLTIIDQITKYLAELHLEPYSPVKIIPNHFHLTLVFNQGAAFGIMRNLPNPWRITVFSVMYVIAFLIIVNLYKQRPPKSKSFPVAISLIAGGAIGNMIDRYRYGYVIDFIDTFPFGYHFPTFNVADSCITIGVGIMLIHMLFFEKGAQNAS
jgi:signal peptidase II